VLLALDGRGAVVGGEAVTTLEPGGGDRCGATAYADGSGRDYPNFSDPELDDWAAAYHAGSYPRLAAVKNAYDPDRFFDFPKPSLDGTSIAHLATVLPDGSPHAVPLWIGTATGSSSSPVQAHAKHATCAATLGWRCPLRPSTTRSRPLSSAGGSSNGLRATRPGKSHHCGLSYK
jgi:hypothetical protein